MVKGLAAALSAALFSGAAGQSISSCGGASDLLQNVKMTIDPDPPSKGQPLTMTISGDLTTALSDLVIEPSLDIQALKIFGHYVIDKKFDIPVPIQTSPAFPAGPFSMKIGPSDVPTIPGSVSIAGPITIKTADGKPVMCIQLNIDVKGEAPTEEPVKEPSKEVAVSDDPAKFDFKNCGTDSDHITGISITQDASGWVTYVGDLDEPLTNFNLDFDIKVQKIITIPFKGAAKVEFIPGFPKGHLVTKVGPVPTLSDTANGLGLKIDGKVEIADGNQEQCACVEVTGEALENDIIV